MKNILLLVVLALFLFTPLSSRANEIDLIEATINTLIKKRCEACPNQDIKTCLEEINLLCEAKIHLEKLKKLQPPPPLSPLPKPALPITQPPQREPSAGLYPEPLPPQRPQSEDEVKKRVLQREKWLQQGKDMYNKK
jgi:hypothetical protein